MSYSPERINPGDNQKIDRIDKVFNETNKKKILDR